MHHDFFDFLLEDEDSAIAGRLILILSLLPAWLRLVRLTLVWLTRSFLILSFLILSLRIWSFLLLGLRARGLSALTLRLLTWWLLRQRLLRAGGLSCDCLVPARYGSEKKNNQ